MDAPKWSILRAKLPGDLSGTASEEIRKLTAPPRAAARVRAAMEAALEYVREIPPIHPDAPSLDGEQRAVAIMLCLAEAGGLHGGGLIDPGAGTERHEAFCGLGTGRRQAGDGEAWTAAISLATSPLSRVQGSSTLRWLGWSTSEGKLVGVVEIYRAGYPAGCIPTDPAARVVLRVPADEVLTGEEEAVLIRRLIVAGVRGGEKMRVLPEGEETHPGWDLDSPGGHYESVILAEALASALERAAIARATEEE